MKRLTTLLILFTVFSINSQTFLFREIDEIRTNYHTIDKPDKTVLVLNGTRVYLSQENGLVTAEGYTVKSSTDYDKLLSLLQRDYDRSFELDDFELGEAFLHKDYKVLCYKNNFTFIFLLYNI